MAFHKAFTDNFSKKSFLSLHFSTLVNVFLIFPFTQSETGYLKFCGDTNKHAILATTCTKGVWFDVPQKPGCVCATGVWVLSDGFCDKKTAIIVGQDHCFHFGFDVRSAKFIGNPSDPFEPSIFTAPGDMDAVFGIPENGLSPAIQAENSIVIGINPNRPLEREDRSLCLHLKDENKWKPVHVYFNPSRSPSKWFYGTNAKCSSVVDYTHHIGFGEMLRWKKILSMDVIGRECLKQCPTEATPVQGSSSPHLMQGRGMSNGKRMRGRGMSNNETAESDVPSTTDETPVSGNDTQANASFGEPREIPDIIVPINSTFDENSANSSKYLVHTNYSIPLKPPKTPDQLAREKVSERAKIAVVLDDYHKELNEQTLRMMHAQISPILLKSENNEVFSREYKYFQKARLVVERLCPKEFVPLKLVRGLMRMFKQLLWEHTNSIRPHDQRADDDQFDRIMTILDNCTANITETERFAYYNYTGSFNFTGANESDPNYPKPEQCPEPLIYGVWGKNIGGEYTVLHNVTGGFHPYLKFNLSLVDMIIETAWKTVMIGHYQCSKSFNDTTAGDFASFFHQMELFFNEKIVKRWYDPASVKSTLEIVKLIFPTYDLKRFAFGIDVCLFAAQQYTDFGWNSKWIQRPKIPYTANEQSQVLFTIPGLGNPISTNDYAPKTSERKKRETKEEESGMVRCLSNYLDPITTFGYVPKSSCNIEKTNEK